MHLTSASLYAFRLSMNQGAVPTFYRRFVGDRSVFTSAFLLAVIGTSMSVFSLVQMQSSPEHQRRLRRIW